MEYGKKKIYLRKTAEGIYDTLMPAISEMIDLLGRCVHSLNDRLHRILPQFSDESTTLPKNPGQEKTAGTKEDSSEPIPRRKILVSRCLYGDEAVRYDGRQIPLQDSIFLKWKEEGRLIPVCPEVDGGLSVPRLPSERQGKKVICCDGTDLTSKYFEGSIQALQQARRHDVAFAIMKENSPACGSSHIYDGKFTGKTIHGEGTAVEILRNADISVFSENELVEASEFLEELEADGCQEAVQGIPRRSGIMRGYKR